MSCDAERVTGYVDRALGPTETSEVESHLAECAACREQAEFERGLGLRLRALPEVELPPGLEDRVRRGLRRRPPSRLRWLLPLAAGLALLVFWARGSAPLIAWELARDHAHCFAKPKLPALVWSSHTEEVAAWFQEKGSPLPALPGSISGVELVGARFCPLPHGTRVAHLYYVGEDRHLSVFVLPHDARIDGGYTARARGQVVHLVRVEGRVVGIVSERQEPVEAFERALHTSVASSPVAAPLALLPQR